MIVTLETLPSILFDLHPGDRIFLQGNLGAGKTTLAQALIRKFLRDPDRIITSPTYTYYQSYPQNLYHFDLYRAEHFDDIVRIGAEEIFDDSTSICLIEWPGILGTTVQPSKILSLSLVEGGREVGILDCQVGCIDKKEKLPTILAL